MSEGTERRRKPLRRTAWTLVIGGFVALVGMIGVGVVLLAGGQEVGPGRSVVWAAGERASVHKRLGPQESPAPRCELFGADGEPEFRALEWADSAYATHEVTIRCEWDSVFLTGTASAVTSAVQSSLIMAPVGAVFAGILLFFPRFTLAWARLSNPLRRR